MREIKFRAWNKESNEMLIWEKYSAYSSMIDFAGNVFDCRNGDVANDTSDVILMQFTGLKDKNGKEIYEGDIIEDSSNGYYGTREVFYNKGGWNIKYISGGRGCTHSQRLPFRHKWFEVIGNIYENPELLK